jgi:hypothetical protein
VFAVLEVMAEASDRQPDWIVIDALKLQIRELAGERKTDAPTMA